MNIDISESRSIAESGSIAVIDRLISRPIGAGAHTRVPECGVTIAEY